MKLTYTCLVLACLFVAVIATPKTLHDEKERARIISVVNKVQPGWTAAPSKFSDRSLQYVAGLCGVKPSGKQLPRYVHTGFDSTDIPTEFDSRTAWPTCQSIKEVRDQADCGSCWAFGAVEAASDRICIETKGASQPRMSAEDLVGCCSECGDGCNGGDPASAWSWFTTTGVVTGGNYNTTNWCSAYSLANCDHHTTGGKYGPCPSSISSTPACPSSCDADSTYTIPYATDKHVFATSYSISSDVSQIQQEILTNGPVEVAFDVYADFESYKSGVYSHVTGDYLGGHAVKMIGWGVDAATNTPYWLIANSWNEDWGEKGFFRIVRGTNECNIESNVVAGKYHA